MADDTADYLARTELLLGEDAMRALAAARVLIVGTGGVGSWCAEALVRSGVCHLTLVDSDRVAPSNVNRQLMATPTTVGELKVEALRRLLLAVNPAAEIEALPVRYAPTDGLDFTRFDIVVDAIDSVDCKAHLIRAALEVPGVTLFSSMGAACKTDVFRLRRSEFRKVEGDGLARALRQRFKKDGAWPCRAFTCVWSDEPRAENRGTPRADEPRANGTVMHVTAAFGLALAGLAIEALCTRH